MSISSKRICALSESSEGVASLFCSDPPPDPPSIDNSSGDRLRHIGDDMDSVAKYQRFFAANPEELQQEYVFYITELVAGGGWMDGFMGEWVYGCEAGRMDY